MAYSKTKLTAYLIFVLAILILIATNVLTHFGIHPKNEEIRGVKGWFARQKYCNHYDEQYLWFWVLSITAILVIIGEIIIAFINKTVNLDGDRPTWISNCFKRLFCRWSCCHNCKCVGIFKNLTTSYPNMFFFVNFIFSSTCLELLSEICDMTYIGWIQSFVVNQLGDRENVEDGRWVSKDPIFFNFFLISMVIEFYIFWLAYERYNARKEQRVSESLVADDISSLKYALLIYFPLPAMTILEYFYVERMGESDSFIENILIIFNNVITLLFMIDLSTRIIDYAISSMKDGTIQVIEFFKIFSGMLSTFIALIRLLANTNAFGALDPIQKLNRNKDCNTFKFLPQDNFKWFDFIILYGCIVIIAIGILEFILC